MLNGKEKLREKELHFVYAELLKHVKKPSLYLGRLRKFSIEVYKVVSKECSEFLNVVFRHRVWSGSDLSRDVASELIPSKWIQDLLPHESLP